MGPGDSLVKQQAQPTAGLNPIQSNSVSHRITVSPGGEHFLCSPDQSILAAALIANLLISYGCRSGLCGSCRGRVISGEIEYPNGFPDAISESDATSGYALLCSAHPITDVTIELLSAETLFD